MPNRIRLAAERDAPGILDIYAPFCGPSPVSFEIAPPSREEMARRVASTTESYPWLVCEDEGRIRGYAYAGRHRERAAYRWSVDVSIYLHPASRGCGLGKVLYSVLFDALRLQGFYRVCAGITLPNPASEALHRRMGFALVGVYHGVGFKAGAWHDVAWWELSLQPEAPDPPEPRTLAAVRATKAWEAILSRGEARLGAGR